MKKQVYTSSFGIYRLQNLSAFLGVDKVSWKPRFFLSFFKANKNNCFIGWGRKKNSNQIQQYAIKNQYHYLILEDGFLRSVGLGVEKNPPLSLVVDDVGIYYDATHPSRLENMIKGDNVGIPAISPFHNVRCLLASTTSDPLNDKAFLSRARTCIDKIISNRLSKYNNSPDITLEPITQARILVIDQTAGDLSISYGMAKKEDFNLMLQAALKEHPNAEIVIKIHPDVIAGKKQGNMEGLAENKRVHLISADINPICLLQQVDHVYTVSSQMGFEALMLGKPVTCFGAPFYAGWGLTDDRMVIPRRGVIRSVEQIFAAAYILYSCYVDPDTGMSCEIERVIQHLSLQKHWFKKNGNYLHCVGFSIWKQGYARRYLQAPWNQIDFVKSTHKKQVKNANIVVWGTRENTQIRQHSEQHGIPIWRMEDGFLRSVGLGSNYTAPASLVLDKIGIYFDSTHPSDLENILQESQFSAADIRRGINLRESIIAADLSKYNFRKNGSLEHSAHPGQTIILVPGQVEDDASIRLGCFDINTNIDLLKSVRNRHPNAYIIYKPHPDVSSGNRKGKRGGDCQALENCDQIVTDISIATCLDAVNEIHTMTSLVGFEGLLRGKQVATYGLPFYAGWGLTKDRHTTKRRTRILTLNQLIVGTLIHYPRYLNISTGEFTTPEFIITQLKAALKEAKNPSIYPSWVTHRISKVNNFIQGVLFG